jgi:hypothetical protein
MPQTLQRVREFLTGLGYYEEGVSIVSGKEYHYFRRGEQDVYPFGIEVRNGMVSDVMWEIIRSMAALNEQDRRGGDDV